MTGWEEFKAWQKKWVEPRNLEADKARLVIVSAAVMKAAGKCYSADLAQQHRLRGVMEFQGHYYYNSGGMWGGQDACEMVNLVRVMSRQLFTGEVVTDPKAYGQALYTAHKCKGQEWVIVPGDWLELIYRADGQYTPEECARAGVSYPYQPPRPGVNRDKPVEDVTGGEQLSLF